MKKITTRDLARAAIMAALVFAASNISIQIPLAVDGTRIHLGNILCILSGLLLGGFYGGCAAGLGSMFFDLFNPLYIASAPFTLVFKFFIGFVSGKVAFGGARNGLNKRYNTIGAIAGSLIYVALYLCKSFWSYILVNGLQVGPAAVLVAEKAIVSGINAAIAVLIAVPLAAAIRGSLDRMGVKPAN